MTRARRRRSGAAPFLVLTIALVAATRADTQSRALPVSDYIAQLDAIRSAVAAWPDAAARATALVRALPATITIQGSGEQFEVSTESIRREFRAAQEGHTAARQRLVRELGTMRSEALRYLDAPAASAAPRALLAQILAGQEFHDLHGPTWADRLRQRIWEFFLRALGLLFRESAIPTVGNVLVYGLIALALLALAAAAYRFVRRRAPAEVVLFEPVMPAPMEWPLWLSQAQAAAARGSWRDAIHFSYWCAVAFLESKGAWRSDPSRTPREYLRLLPASSEERATLAALTRRFELVWYGDVHADEAAFAESIANLKKIGCPAA
jgi:hypothetical protein